MSDGFVHSVKVPRLYKTAASIARSVREEGASFKTLLYQRKHPNVSGLYALITNTLQRGSQLDYLVRKTRIFLTEPRLDPWLARVLITELIWGKQSLKSDCKPVQTVLSYQNQLREALNSIDNIPEPCTKRAKKPRYVRVNTLMISVEDAIYGFENEGWSLLPKCSNYNTYLDTLKDLSDPYFIQDFHIPEVLVFPSHVSFYNHGAYIEGEIILQDKASCLPAHILQPARESTVIDMCAAPGMKTSHIAALMGNTGKVYAVEINAQRYGTLCEQIEKTQCICVKPIHKDALTLDINQCPDVEYILVDPSCTGSGMTDRQSIESVEQKSYPERMKGLQAFQVFLLRHALFNFPTVKKVVYSTCSVNPEENEKVIDEILIDIKDAYRLVPVKEVFGKNWINYSSAEYECADKCLYARPDIDMCNGFFIAIFERNFDVPLPAYKRKPINALNDKFAESATDKKSRKRKKRGKKKAKVQDDSVKQEVAKTQPEEFEGLSESVIQYNDTTEQLAEEEPSKKKKKKKSKHKDRETVQAEDTEPEVEEILEVYNSKDLANIPLVNLTDA